MKRILLMLIVGLPLISCSNNDPEPDLTEKFVGSWKSEPEDIGPYISVDTWVIDKISNDHVRVIVKNEWKSKDLQVSPNDEGSTVLDDVKINSEGIMILEYRETVDKVTYEAKGKGIVKGNRLSVSLVATSLADASTESYVEELTKVSK